MTHFVKSFVKNDSGATAIEYALIAALISVAAIIAFRLLGKQITKTMTQVTDAMATAG